MKIKNINASFFILLSLIFLSFSFYVAAQTSSTSTQSVFLDSDQDGLSDEEEKNIGTDPNKADTDGDSYSDGTEVRSGYDPLKPAPGDKLSTATTIATPSTTTTPSPTNPTDTTSTVLGDSTEQNLTTTVAQKISELADKSTTDNTQISLDDVQTLVDQSLTPATVSVGLNDLAVVGLYKSLPTWGVCNEALFDVVIDDCDDHYRTRWYS